MKAKRILQSALAVIMAVFMLSSCGAAEDVSADGDNRLTRAEEEAEETAAETKEDTAKPAGEATGEEAKSATDETTTNAETSTDIKYFPDKTFFYDKYIIDSVTGEILLTTDEWESFDKNLLKYTDGYGNTRYVDANGSDVTSLITNGYEVFRDDSSNYGVKDKNGNIVIEAMYDSLEGYLDNTYFYFKLNDAYGVLNEKGEIIIKGLPSNIDYISYPENIVTDKSIYSLPSGELIGEYDQVFAFGDKKSFLVKYVDENSNICINIIDSKGNLISDLLAEYPGTINEDSDIEFIVQENICTVNVYGQYAAFFNGQGKNLEGWIDCEGSEYSGSLINTEGRIFSYFLTNLKCGILFGKNFYNNNWSFEKSEIILYDYSGNKLGNFESTASLYYTNGKVFKEEDSNVFIRADGSKIGDFSRYEKEPVYQFSPYHNYTENWSNAVIVTDTDGMFKGVIIGDELKYPCEYTSIECVWESYCYVGIGNAEDGQLLKLQKGNETIYITAESGAVVNLPQ